jgi:hypothetical protein
MRQVLLAPVDDRRSESPVVLWMEDGTRIGDGFKWHGVRWAVRAIYGTRFSKGGRVARRDKAVRHDDNADQSALAIE